MNEFLKMDIFFFVTTVAVLALSGVLFFIALKILKILGHVEHIMEIAAEETENIKDDIADLRADIRTRGFGIMSLSRFVSKYTSRFSHRSRKKKGGE